MKIKKEELEEIFEDTLTNINKNLLNFFKYYRKEFKNDEKVLEIFYTNPIFRNRKKLIFLADIIKKTENHLKNKIKENKQKTEMYNTRLNEMNQIKNFVEANKKILVDVNNNQLIESENENNIIKKNNNKENNNMNYFRECYCCKINIVENNLHFFYSNL